MSAVHRRSRAGLMLDAVLLVAATFSSIAMGWGLAFGSVILLVLAGGAVVGQRQTWWGLPTAAAALAGALGLLAGLRLITLGGICVAIFAVAAALTTAYRQPSER